MQAHYWLVLQLVFPTSQLILTILYNFEPSTRNVSFCIGHHEEPKIIFQYWLRIYWQNIHWFDIFPFSYCNNVENIKSSTTYIGQHLNEQDGVVLKRQSKLMESKRRQGKDKLTSGNIDGKYWCPLQVDY